MNDWRSYVTRAFAHVNTTDFIRKTFPNINIRLVPNGHHHVYLRGRSPTMASAQFTGWQHFSSVKSLLIFPSHGHHIPGDQICRCGTYGANHYVNVRVQLYFDKGLLRACWDKYRQAMWTPNQLLCVEPSIHTARERSLCEAFAGLRAVRLIPA